MIIIIYLFIIGSVIASFANALIYRIPRQIAIYKGRSYCENCYHLTNQERCPYCHSAALREVHDDDYCFFFFFKSR